jgi:uncharacterized OB-fold protein
MMVEDDKNVDEFWWQAIAEDKLLFQRCARCDTAIFYPREACVNCLSPDLNWVESSRAGSVYSITTVHRAPDPAFAADAPYDVALAEMDDGFRMLARVKKRGPADTVGIGGRIEVVFSPGADGRPCPWFQSSEAGGGIR